MTITNKTKVKKKSLKYLIIWNRQEVTTPIKLEGFEGRMTFCKSSVTKDPLIILYSESKREKKLSKFEMETFRKNFNSETDFIIKHLKV